VKSASKTKDQTIIATNLNYSSKIGYHKIVENIVDCFL
jgi:hypothetical protein